MGLEEKDAEKDTEDIKDMEEDDTNAELEKAFKSVERADEAAMGPMEAEGSTQAFGPTAPADSSESDTTEFVMRKGLRLWKFEIGISKKMLMLIILNSVVVSFILVINFFLFRDVFSLFSSINVIAAFIFVFPIVTIRYSRYKKKREIEEMFPVFLRDFVEAVRGGMTIPHAIKSVSNNDYRSLSPHVKKMAIQIGWGVPVEKVLINFSKRIKSKLISRIISSVRESHRFGGNLADTFEALSNTAVEVERLREERRLYLHSQMITGYVIFFIFLAVMIGLQKFLVPAFKETAAAGTALGPGVAVVGDANKISPEEIAVQYKVIFRNLILIQGFFAGLAVGKMGEGSMVAGLKHSMVMILIGVLAFAIAV